MVTNYLIQYIANYLLLLVRGHFNIQDVEDTCTQAHPDSDNFHSVVLPKVMAYYPLHFLSSAIFCADVHLGGEELQRDLEHDCSLTQQNKCRRMFSFWDVLMLSVIHIFSAFTFSGRCKQSPWG